MLIVTGMALRLEDELRRLDHGADALGEDPRAVERDAAAEDRELLAAVAAEDVLGAHAGGCDLRELREHVIARDVTVRVVDAS